MSQFNDTGYATVTLTETVGQYLRTNFAGELCGITERGVGYATVSGVSGDVVSVALHSKPGTVKVVAAAAIAVDAIVYSAASGKVSTSASTAFPLGIARTASSANGDVIEIMPLVGETAVS
jgi:hypothetical protein